MFRQITHTIPDDANKLFLLHPSELILILEYAWKNRLDLKKVNDIVFSPGDPFNRSILPCLPSEWLDPVRRALNLDSAPLPRIEATSKNIDVCITMWDHLIYAYMIENTRIYEIFWRVIQEFLHGERLGVPSAATHQWMRNTEELFYRDPPSFSITTLNSYIRPDLRASRRNAYQRMFGMDLNHGTADNKPYPYIRADVSNNEFVSTFEEFLREVWIGITNYTNTSGAKPTDDGKITNLVESLYNMLISRRRYGNLSREEFAFVSMMSWFHLTLEYDFPVVKDLRAEAASPEQRLFKIAQRVGLPAHGLSRSYFEIADPISRVLILIETGVLNVEANVPALYTLGPLKDSMNSIITHWSIITGRDMKARKVAAT